MAATPSSDVTRLRTALANAEAEAARTRAINADLAARVALLELQNEKMRRALYSQRAERGHLLVDQLELAYEETEATASEDEAHGMHVTLADQVGACAASLKPLHLLIEAHVLAAERLHGDDTTVPVLAKTKTDVARLWTYVRDDRPFAGPAPPAALFRYSRDRRAERPLAHLTGYGGILQADAYAGYNALFRAGRLPAPLTRALCWAHGRRKFFELADAATQLKRRKGPPVISPVAAEAVRRIDRVFDGERAITGTTVAHRLAARQEIAAPLSPSSSNGCAPSVRRSPATTRSLARSTTCSTTGAPSPGSSPTAVSA